MIAYLDCFNGISGDMFLGALLDAGVDPEALLTGLESLELPGWSLTVEEVDRAGFRGLQAKVHVEVDQPARTHRDIVSLIENADLEADVTDRSLAVFDALAQVEAKVHGVETGDVHFHEVGAVDSIVDIVGAAIGVSALGIERLVCSPVSVGAGQVRTEHGLLPVPAPATVELLAGVPVRGGPEEGELTTPTGAALVTVLADSYGDMPAMVPSAVGLGAGSRDTAAPNLLRLVLGEPVETAGDETVVALLSVIDHRTPEELATALDTLRADGALDTWQTPIVMKKGRAGIEVTVLARPVDAARLAEGLMRETGTLGVRRQFVARTVADRAVMTIDTSLGAVRFKVGRAGEARQIRPEHDDVARIAESTGRPIHDVAEQLTAEARTLLG